MQQQWKTYAGIIAAIVVTAVLSRIWNPPLETVLLITAAMTVITAIVLALFFRSVRKGRARDE